jgi:predicted aconitase with swiveling domain
MRRDRVHREAFVSATITVRRAYGATVEGEALVMREGFSPRYDLDRLSGQISRIGHSAEGLSIKDRILIIPTVKGGVAGGWAFFDLVHKGIAPRALVFGKLNPVMVQGAVLAQMPVTEGWSENLVETLRHGDLLRVDPGARTITVLRRA